MSNIISFSPPPKPKVSPPPPEPKCAFCGKSKSQVPFLIQFDKNKALCSICVIKCNQLLQEN